MNPETTGCADGRAELVLRAAVALESAAEAAARELDRHAAAFGLSDAKLEMLGVLECCQERRACLYDLGERLRVTRPNITKLVDGLERGGLVERLPHPDDKRMVQAHLTPAGEAVARAALPGRRECLERMWEGLDDDDLEVLVRLLGVASVPAERGVAAPA